MSRSTLGATAALEMSKRLADRKAPAGHRPALLWLRLRRAPLYRRVALCDALEVADALDRSDALPNTIRRYGRLKINCVRHAKRLWRFSSLLLARNERGERRREGELIKSASSPRPFPPFVRRRGRENTVARSEQIFRRTQLIENLRYGKHTQNAGLFSRCPSGTNKRGNRR